MRVVNVKHVILRFLDQAGFGCYGSNLYLGVS